MSRRSSRNLMKSASIIRWASFFSLIFSFLNTPYTTDRAGSLTLALVPCMHSPGAGATLLRLRIPSTTGICYTKRANTVVFYAKPPSIFLDKVCAYPCLFCVDLLCFEITAYRVSLDAIACGSVGNEYLSEFLWLARSLCS